MSLINEVRSWFTDLFNGEARQSLWTKISDMKPNGGLNVNPLNLRTQEISKFLVLPEIETALLVIPTSINDTTVTLTSGHGATVGKTLCLRGSQRFFQAEIIAVVGNVLTLDYPLDFTFPITTDVCIGEKSLALSGSISVPQIFRARPPKGVKWEISRIHIFMLDATIMDDGKFAGGSALVNGMVFRTINGITQNHFNLKTNGDIGLETFDLNYTLKAPAGFYGLRARRTYAGPDKSGVALFLDGDTNDELQVLVRDNLSLITSIQMKVQGHVVKE